MDVDETTKRLLEDHPRPTTALGLYHSCVLSRKGELYVWGGNSNGQLGLGSKEVKKKKVTATKLRTALRQKMQDPANAEHAKEYTDSKIKKMELSELRFAMEKVDPEEFRKMNDVRKREPVDDQVLPQKLNLPIKHSHTILQVCCGIKHTMALTNDLKLWVWGSGANGKLGLGQENGRTDFDDEHSPKIVDALSKKKVVRIECGTDSSAALTDSGEIFTWGVGRYGNLGHGDNDMVHTPKVIDALLGKRMIAITMGSKHTLAIQMLDDETKSNIVWAWGSGASGRLGGESDDGQFRPIRVKALDNKFIVQLSAGETHSMALSKDGHVYTWGSGDYGKLGHGDTSNVRHPKIIDEFTNVKIKAIAAGSFSSIALTRHGKLYSWGGGSYGKLGHGDYTNQIVPRLVERADNIVEASAGSFHSSCITSVGNLYMFGYGGNGRLGNGHTASSNIPTQVRDLKNEIMVHVNLKTIESNKRDDGITLMDVIQPRQIDRVICGGFHTFVLTDQGMFWAMGDGRYGQLGLNLDGMKRSDKREKLEPVYVPGLDNVKFLTAGLNHSMAITDEMRLWTWGRGLGGALGHGDAADQPEPRLIRTLGHKKIVHCAANELHSACCTDEGECWTWGMCDFGKLGHGELNDESTPRLVVALDGKVVCQVATGFSHTLALIKGTCDIYAWGSGHEYKLGLNDEFNRTEPTLVVALKRRNIVDIVCGAFFSLALSSKGLVYSWGSNTSGQLGRRSDPTSVNMIEDLRSKRVIKVAAGESHGGAITDEGEVWTWGANAYGQLGHGHLETVLQPVRINQLVGIVCTDLACGSNHTAVITSDALLYCWGNGANGRLGLLNTVDIQSKPVRCVAIDQALNETGKVGPDMLKDLNGTGIEIDKMEGYLDKSRDISKRVNEKLGAGEDVNMGDELDGVDLGDDPGMRENIILVKAAAMSTGAEPVTLASLQQLVKSEEHDVRLEMVEEEQKIDALRNDMDQIVRKNNKQEMDIIETQVKIHNVLKNQLQLQLKLSAAEKYNPHELKLINQPDDDIAELPLEQYAQMLSICYEKPSVLLFLCESIGMEEKEDRERMWAIIMFTLYGDQTQARDEYNLLSLAHMLFNERSAKVPRTEMLLDRTEHIGMLISEYLKRDASRRACRITLSPVVNDVLERGQHLDPDPVSIFKTLHSNAPAEDLEYVTRQSALTDIEVRELYEQNIHVIQHQVQQFLKRITSSAGRLPFGVRWFARRLWEIADEKLPNTKDKEQLRTSLVCKFLMSHLFNEGIAFPENMGITAEPPPTTIKHNLVVIMGVLNKVAAQEFYLHNSDEGHMMQFNKIVRGSRDLLDAFVDQVVTVKSLEQHNRESRYIQTLSSLTPTIHISMNDMDFLHRLIEQGFRAGTLPGEKKEWIKIVTKAGGVHGDVEEQMNQMINVPIRLSERVIWPEQEPENERVVETDICTTLLIALQELHLLPLSVSGTLPENLEKAKSEATKAESFNAADKLQEVLQYVQNKMGENHQENKIWSDNFLRSTARQIKMLAIERNMLRQEYESLRKMTGQLRMHGTHLNQAVDRGRQYLNNVKQKKLTHKNVKLTKRKKERKDEFGRQLEARKKAEALDSSLLVRSSLNDTHRKLMTNDLKQFIEARIETLRKIELAEEVDLNTEWSHLFKDNPELMELIGRTPALESLIAKNPDLQTVMELNPKFAEILYANPDLTPNELKDFILSNDELHDFISDNDDLKELLDKRAVMHQKNKAAVMAATDEIELGPMYSMRYEKCVKAGVLVKIDFPDRILRKCTLQFSSSLRGTVDILCFDKKKQRAIGQYKVTKEDLIDRIGTDIRFVESNNAKFNCEKLVAFLDTHLRW